jgi:UDP-2,3-diacylglucosamine hydrolase
MSHNSIEIKEGAFVVSDAHYSHLRPELFSLLQEIHSGILKPTQLILMGDIFDALFGYVTTTCKNNARMIEFINDISKKIEVIYLEGNHDFNLQKVFPLANVFSINEQPVICSFGSKKIALAHGDFDGDFGYQLYTSLIRNKAIVIMLNLIDKLSYHTILKEIDAHLGKKDDCKEFVGFRDFIARRSLQKYECDYFVEGHFHQNISFDLEKFHYINLGAFACNQRYFIVKSFQDNELLEEKMFSKEI